MQVTMTREALRGGLDVVAGALKEKSSLPVLATVLAEVVPDGLRLTATDLDQAIQTTVPADVSGNGAKAITLPGKRLCTIAKQLPNAAVRLAHTKKTVKLECAKVSYDLRSISADEFPNLPVVDFSTHWTLPGEELAHVQHVAFAVSHAESRPTLTGVYWQCREGKMRMVATDGFRLARREAGSCCDGPKDLIVPATAMTLAAELFADTETVEIASSSNWLGFRSPSVLYLTRLIEGPYPEYERIFVPEYEQTATIDRDVLVAACKRLVPMADEVSYVNLDFTPTICTLSVPGTDIGKGREEIACAFTGKPLTIGCNLHYLQEAASHVEQDSMEISFNGEGRGFRLRGVGERDYVQLLQPLRLRP